MMLRSLAAASVIALAGLGAGVAGAPVAQAQQPQVNRWPLLLELAETLGRTHWARILCKGDGDETWRRYMMEFLSLEGRERSQYDALVNSFNKGYYAQAAKDKTCAEAGGVEAQLARRGRDISDQLTRTYLQ